MPCGIASRNDYGNDNVAADAYNIVEPLLIRRGLLDNLPAAVGLDGDEVSSASSNLPRTSLENRCEEALPRLEEYIRQIPAGRYISEAQFYAGNCQFEQGNPEEAYAAYVAVLAMPAGEFTEASSLGAATIAWNAGDHRAALGHYETLEEVAMLQPTGSRHRPNALSRYLPRTRKPSRRLRGTRDVRPRHARRHSSHCQLRMRVSRAIKVSTARCSRTSTNS